MTEPVQGRPAARVSIINARCERTICLDARRARDAEADASLQDRDTESCRPR
jgi:hypothetical protein